MSELELGLPDVEPVPEEPDLFEAWARLKRQADCGRLFAHPEECKVNIADLRVVLAWADGQRDLTDEQLRVMVLTYRRQAEKIGPSFVRPAEIRAMRAAHEAATGGRL